MSEKEGEGHALELGRESSGKGRYGCRDGEEWAQ